MVEILCPHCEEEIALDDDASGEFVCPHCDGEFDWNIEPEGDWNQIQEYNESMSSNDLKIISGVFCLFFLAGIVMIIVGIAGVGLCADFSINQQRTPLGFFRRGSYC